MSIYHEIDGRTEALRSTLADETKRNDFNERLDMSWIYHDHRLEGVVLTYHELNSAIDEAIISDITLIPQYENVINHKEAIRYCRTYAQKKKPDLNLEFLKKLHCILSTEIGPRPAKAPPKPPPGQYRKDNPLHRMYFHEIAPPEKISYKMRKLVQWLVSDEAKKLHPVKRAAFAHHKLIAIFPWPRYSAKIARLLMNTILVSNGYLPAIIHAIERQRYYDVLRQPSIELAGLVAESLNRTLESALELFGIEDVPLLEGSVKSASVRSA